MSNGITISINKIWIATFKEIEIIMKYYQNRFVQTRPDLYLETRWDESTLLDWELQQSKGNIHPNIHILHSLFWYKLQHIHAQENPCETFFDLLDRRNFHSIFHENLEKNDVYSVFTIPNPIHIIVNSRTKLLLELDLIS